MQKVEILYPETYLSMLWRNGLGSTVEIMKRNRPGSEDFAWRISMAAVVADGPFSCFKNYDRTLLLLDGNGVTLGINKDQTDFTEDISLHNSLQAARFRGDDPTVATLHDGPITDFNIMTHRDHCDAEVVCGHQSEERRVTVDCDEIVIYCVTGELVIESASGEKWTLPGRCSLYISKPAKQHFVIAGGAFIAIQIAWNDAN